MHLEDQLTDKNLMVVYLSAHSIEIVSGIL